MYNFYKTERVPRERLYELVWAQPMQKLAAEVGISDVALAKTCRKAGIPLPPRGYWARLAAGKSVPRTALPVRELGEDTHIDISGNIAAAVRRHFGAEVGGLVDGPYEDIDVMSARFRKRVGKIGVPRDFAKAHPEIRKLLDKDEMHRHKKMTERWYYHNPVFDTPFERRRLRIINALLIAAARAGGKGWVRGNDAREFGITIGDQPLNFTLDKPQNRSGRRGTTNIGRSERLALTLSAHQPPEGAVTGWQDEEGAALEKRFGDIFIEIGVTAERLHRAWVRRMIDWELERKAAAEEAERQRIAEEERLRRERLAALAQARLDALNADAAALHQAGNIRAYVATVREHLGSAVPAERIDQWAAWALAEANRIDPLVSGRALEMLEKLAQDEDEAEGKGQEQNG